MNKWNLQLVLTHFSDYVKNIDFTNLPPKESEAYRQLIQQTANDQIFCDGRYSYITEWILEMYDIPEVVEMMHSLSEINKLTDDERMRLGFYMDLGTTCYPLFRGMKIDWSEWPWLMKDGSGSMDNQELFDTVTNGQRPYLSAAILYDLKEVVWKDEEFYSSVVRQEVAHAFFYGVESLWNRDSKTEEEKKKFLAALDEFANKLWFAENHLHVGRQLGFDYLTQSVYDAMDTYIASTYRHRQVDFAKALSAWIRQNMTIGERYPSQEKVDALYDQMKALMAQYNVSTPDKSYTWNILTWDVLGMSPFPEHKEQDEDDLWDEDDID